MVWCRLPKETVKKQQYSREKCPLILNYCAKISVATRPKRPERRPHLPLVSGVCLGLSGGSAEAHRPPNIIKKSLSITSAAHYDKRGARLSPERRRAAFMEPPVSKLGPTSGIVLGNVFGVQCILCHPAGNSAKFLPFFTPPVPVGRLR